MASRAVVVVATIGCMIVLASIVAIVYVALATPQWSCDGMHGKPIAEVLSTIKADRATKGSTVYLLKRGNTVQVPNDRKAYYITVDESNNTQWSCYHGNTKPSHSSGGVLGVYDPIGSTYNGTYPPA